MLGIFKLTGKPNLCNQNKMLLVGLNSALQNKQRRNEPRAITAQKIKTSSYLTKTFDIFPVAQALRMVCFRGWSSSPIRNFLKSSTFGPFECKGYSDNTLLGFNGSNIARFSPTPIFKLSEQVKRIMSKNLGVVLRFKRIPRTVRKNLKGRERFKIELVILGADDRSKYNFRLYRLILTNKEATSSDFMPEGRELGWRPISSVFWSSIGHLGLMGYDQSLVLKRAQYHMFKNYAESGAKRVK